MGRDILTYVPGRTTDHPGQRADGAYARGAAMLRELHDLTAGNPLAAGRECVVHGDAGAFNTIFAGGMPVAFIDWTSCRPGERLEDFGYMAWTWRIQSEGNVPIASQAEHLRELRDGYGPPGGNGHLIAADVLVDAMLRSQDRIAEVCGRLARDARQSAGQRAWAKIAVNWATADRRLIRANKQILLSALR